MTLYQKSLSDFKNSYVGFSALVIIGQSCLGAAAAMYVLENGTSMFQMFQLTLVVLTCMLVNVAILAQLSAKTVFDMTIFSALLSILLIVLNVMVI